MKEWREEGEEGRKVVDHTRAFEKRLPKKKINRILRGGSVFCTLGFRFPGSRSERKSKF